MEHTLCFTGQKFIPYPYRRTLQMLLDQELYRLIEQSNITDLLVGDSIGFDTEAALSVLRCKNQYPHIQLHLIIPYPGYESGRSAYDLHRKREIHDWADEILYTSTRYQRGCLQKRDRYLVDNSSGCICYQKSRRDSSSRFMLQYAIKRGLPVINLADQMTTSC